MEFCFPAPQRAWCLTPGMSILGKVKQEDCCKFEAGIGSMVKDQASQGYTHSKTFHDKNKLKQLTVVAHVYNPSTGEMEAGRLFSWIYPGLPSETQSWNTKRSA